MPDICTPTGGVWSFATGATPAAAAPAAPEPEPDQGEGAASEYLPSIAAMESIAAMSEGAPRNSFVRETSDLAGIGGHFVSWF